jgi:hypothetical protein
MTPDDLKKLRQTANGGSCSEKAQAIHTLVNAIDDITNGVGPYGRVIDAARAKLKSDDAVFMATQGDRAGDFDRLGKEARAVEEELRAATRALNIEREKAGTF